MPHSKTAITSAGFSLLLGLFIASTPVHSADVSSPVQSTNKSKMNTPTNVTPAEAESLLASSRDVVVVDVRTQEEFAEGHIAGARNVNFNSPNFVEKMQEFTGKKVLLHCASGGRSSRAIEALSSTSFAQLYHLNKGFNAWQEAGKPVTTK
jgi:rhodanese-related sulfurtransferase